MPDSQQWLGSFHRRKPGTAKNHSPVLLYPLGADLQDNQSDPER
jgi:hypothetical protein